MHKPTSCKAPRPCVAHDIPLVTQEQFARTIDAVSKFRAPIVALLLYTSPERPAAVIAVTSSVCEDCHSLRLHVINTAL